jgi:hypothetical protein
MPDGLNCSVSGFRYNISFIYMKKQKISIMEAGSLGVVRAGRGEGFSRVLGKNIRA